MEITGTTLLKVLGENGEACHGGNGTWFLPNGKPGKWMPKIENPKPCVRGYHLVTARQALEGSWLGPRIFVAEARGKRVDDGNKSVHEQARLLYEVKQWNERTARLFACLCAERALPIYEKHERSKAPRRAIEVARLFAGAVSDSERSAAGSAARSAAWSWQTERLLELFNAPGEWT